MTIRFIADLHFNHFNIISFCKRPYKTVDEMNHDMVAKFNAVVGHDDDTWILGDLAWPGGEQYFHQLNGRKHLIIGNHDHRSVLILPWATAPRHYHEMKLLDGEGILRQLVLFHYPIEEWNHFYGGAIHLHGHVHGKTMKPSEKLRVDVAVDCFNFTPVTLDEILASVK
jgi:calcineurin-like phosphoesterase family protein